MKEVEKFSVRVRAFMEGSKSERNLVLYHKDVDGLCSALLFSRVLESFGASAKFVPASNEEMKLGLMKGFDRIVVLDIDISYLGKELKRLKKDFLLIDHHPPRADLNSRRIIYVNPRLTKPKTYQPTSYITYKLFSGLVDLRDVEWLAAIGTIGDYGFEDCLDLLKKWTKAKSVLKSKLWLYARMICGLSLKFGFEKAFEILRVINSLEEFKRNEKVRKAYLDFLRKYEKLEKKFWNNAEFFDETNLIFSNIGRENRILSSLFSTELSAKTPKKVVIIFRKVNGKYAVNARCRGLNVDLGRIMHESAKGLNGGGGHQQAAGATILERNKEIFKKRVIRKLRILLKEKSKI